MNLIEIPATKVFLDTWEAVQSGLYKLICQEGSSRSSKTWSDFLVHFKYAYERRHKVINILRDTAIDCRDIVETEWVKWLSDPCNRTKEFEEGKISMAHYVNFLKKEDLRRLFNENKTKHIWTMKHTGTTIRFTGLDDDDKVMGMTQDVCHVNEPYNFAHEVYKQLSQRTSDYMLIDWNPKKKHWIDEEKKKENAIVLKSTFRDNPFCPKKQKDQILSYQPLSHINVIISGLLIVDEAMQYDVILNDKKLTQSQIDELARCRRNENERSASVYHWEVYGMGLHSELPNRIYRWEEISLHDYYQIDVPKYYYSDWGSVDPWAIGEVKYLDGNLYVRELNYSSENEMRSKMSATELQQVGVAEDGIVSWLFRKLNIPYSRPVICDSNRPNKIIALRESGWEYSVAVQKKQVGPERSSIIDGVDLLNNLNVFYTSDSDNIKEEQDTYCRKIDINGIVTDQPEDMNNHHMDGIRYVGLFLQQEGVIKKV